MLDPHHRGQTKLPQFDPANSRAAIEGDCSDPSLETVGTPQFAAPAAVTPIKNRGPILSGSQSFRGQSNLSRWHIALLKISRRNVGPTPTVPSIDIRLNSYSSYFRLPKHFDHCCGCSTQKAPATSDEKNWVREV